MAIIPIAMCAITGTALAQTVDAPASNDPVVNSPFYLQAEAPTCAGLSTASMAYSYDSHTDHVFSGAQSIQTMVTISDDSTPTLHVKAWNTNGALCEKNLSLNIGGGVTVSTPAQGGNVPNPFTLTAQAATCGGQTTSSMAYTVDSNSDTVFSGAHSINTSVSAAAGWHILRVKAWGNGGAYCETDVHIYSSGSGGITWPQNANSYSNMENDATYNGAYANCGGATGPHASMWQTQPDCATFKGATPSVGSTSQVSSPVYGGDTISRQFAMTHYYRAGEGVRWFDSRAADDSATYFGYDAYVYIPDVSQVMNIEMDVNHALSTSNTLYILAAQCALDAGVWQVTINGSWVSTNATCTRSQVTSGAWHHFQIQSHHDANAGSGIHYDAVALDGTVTNITTCGGTSNCTSTSESLGWAGVIGPNFQLDGENSSGSATAYVDNFTIYFW